MRWISGALALALISGVVPEQSLPPEQRQQIQKQTEELAQIKAQEMADRIRATISGSLDAAENLAFHRWERAIQQWKREKGAGAAPFLAEGVLFDCLSRLEGVNTRVLLSEEPVPYFADLAAKRPARAAKAFEAALKIEPQLIEARMRLARIRALKEPAGATELEKLAESSIGSPYSYLSAMSRAEVARRVRDLPGAIHWYERAIKFYPGSTAAMIALASLTQESVLSFDSRGDSDVYYSYPCTLLSSDVNAELSRRVQAIGVK